MIPLATAIPPVSPLVLPRAAYVHVPFCAHRCGYCDFTLIAGRDDLVGDYLQSLEREMDSAKLPIAPSPLDTLFFGGGTPTHPAPAELKALLQIVSRRFGITSATEFSVEANPLDLSDEKIQILAEGGVNRISLGVQSFSNSSLQLLERDHTTNDIERVIGRLCRAFTNFSLDLIFGVPGQTMADWRDTLRRAIDLGPTHLSTYGLTFEPGTAFWTRRQRGEFHGIEEEFERELYAVSMEVLTAAGYVQYEISNFSKPGYQCRHNNVYWNGDEYWAFGPGAARYLHGRRETNLRSVLGWLARMDRGESPVAESEELEPSHRARELIYLGLRRNRGINRKWFRERTGFDLDEISGAALVSQTELGLIEDDGSDIRLTHAGRFVADRVVMEFL